MTEKVPSITVQDFGYKNIDLLSIYKNKNLLLLLYNNSCLGCTGRAIPLAYNFQKQYESVQVIGIHCNFGSTKTTRENIKSIFTINELPFPIYLDETHAVYDYFKSEGTPQWIIINKDGTLYRSIFGSQSNAENRLHYALESLVE